MLLWDRVGVHVAVAPVATRRLAGRLSVLVLLGLLVPLCTAASAEEKIGSTALTHNMVERVAAKPGAIKPGDDVFADENVRTGTESAAKFVFSDETNLALGPTSTVTLDRFVYKGETTYAKAAVNFTAGFFRFTTGGSDKKAYQLRTNTATIGVRGTIFDVRVNGDVTTVTLVEGDVVVCPRKNYGGDPRLLNAAQMRRYHCQELSRPGQTALISSRNASLGSAPFDFASNFCSDSGTLCSVTKVATVTQQGGIMCYMKPDQ